MLRPSYNDLMEAINGESQEGEDPVVNSRYSIVIAAAKRARQIIAGDDGLEESTSGKALSTAVEELRSGAVKILSGGKEDEVEEHRITNGSSAINEESLDETDMIEDEEEDRDEDDEDRDADEEEEEDY